MLNLSECQNIERLELLSSEDVPPSYREWVERHLESCSTCQERLDQTGKADPFRTLGQQFGDPTAGPPDPTLAEFLQRLRRSNPPPGEFQEPVDLYFLQPTEKEDLLGMLGPYEVQEVIGQGGMGVVLKAFEPALQRVVAIKVLSPALAGSATARRRFTREAQSSASVRHENIITIHGVDEIQSLPYFVMEYVAGESLQDLLNRNGHLELTEIVRIGSEIASGLAAAHEQGLIHRDIKPANILMEKGTNRVKITDFGLARMVDDVQLTQNGVVVGTPEYMAPEQARGEPVNPRADLFSLGGVLYALCTGSPPFSGSSTLAVLRSIAEDTPPPASSINNKIPSWLDHLIALLLAKDGNHRLQNTKQVAALLGGYLAHLKQPNNAPCPDLPPLPVQQQQATQNPSLKSRKTFRWPVCLAALLLLLLGSGLGLFTVLFAQIDQPNVNFSHDFRGTSLPPELDYCGGGAKYFHQEAEGFRITLPNHWQHPRGGTGLMTTFGLKGDFEIIATAEILNAKNPPAVFGAGVRLYVHMSDSMKAATICRLVRPGNRQVIAWDQAFEVDGKRKYHIDKEECTEAKVSLCLKRKGTTLYYLWAPGESKDFTELHHTEFGSDPIKNVT